MSQKDRSRREEQKKPRTQTSSPRPKRPTPLKTALGVREKRAEKANVKKRANPRGETIELYKAREKEKKTKKGRKMNAAGKRLRSRGKRTTRKRKSFLHARETCLTTLVWNLGKDILGERF